MSFDQNKELEYQMLQDEVTQLRIVANHNSLISNFTELMYDAESEEELLSILLFALPQVIPISKMRYFSLNKVTLELVEEYQFDADHNDSAQKIENGLVKPVTFFGNTLEDSILQQEFFTIENGISEGDEFSLRFDCDRYIVAPLLARNLRNKGFIDNKIHREEFRSDLDYQKAYICSSTYPALGAFWLDITTVPDSTIASSISLVTSLLHTAGAVIGELRMVEQITAINNRTEKDLKAAREVQLGLLPKTLPNNDTLQAAAQYLTEDQVGGDYYDIFPLSDTTYGIMVADASGHGTPSALIMAMTKILLKSFASDSISPGETLEKINHAIVNNAKTNKFITCFYAILDIENCTLHYTSAGHCPQLLINKKNDNTKELDSDGVFVGMFPALNLQSHTINYKPGENRLVLYTDGLTESTNNEDKMYGIARLKNSAISTKELHPKEALEQMLTLYQRYIRNHPKDDDLTLMVIDF